MAEEMMTNKTQETNPEVSGTTPNPATPNPFMNGFVAGGGLATLATSAFFALKQKHDASKKAKESRKQAYAEADQARDQILKERGYGKKEKVKKQNLEEQVKTLTGMVVTLSDKLDALTPKEENKEETKE